MMHAKHGNRILGRSAWLLLAVAVGGALVAPVADAGSAFANYFKTGGTCGLVTCTSGVLGGSVHIDCPDDIAPGDRCSAWVGGENDNRHSSPFLGPISVHAQLAGSHVNGGTICSNAPLLAAGAFCTGQLTGTFRADTPTGNPSCPTWGEFTVVSDASSTLGGGYRLGAAFSVCRFPGGPTSVTVHTFQT
jgi:hypothetical protein